MSDNVTLPGVGTITESKDIGGGIQRQSVMVGDRAGTSADVIGPINETAPINDTAPSSLNGRLQRIAQNLTTQRSSTQAVSVNDGQDITFGSRSDAKSTATDGTSVSAMSVFKQISAYLSSIGTAVAGTLSVTGSVASSGATSIVAGGIATTYRLVSAVNTTNPNLVKTGAGRVYFIQGYNAASSLRYLKLYNKASAPTVGTDPPVKTLALPATSAFSFGWSDIGLYFPTGIGFGLTTGSADADTGVLTAADITCLNIDYA